MGVAIQAGRTALPAGSGHKETIKRLEQTLPVSAAGDIDEDDRDLLRQMTEAADRNAFERLYHLYRRRLGPFLYRIVRDPAANEEIYNDVMLAVWRKPQAYNGESKVSTWIFAIAYRLALKWLRDQKTPPQLDAPEATDDFEGYERSDLLRQALDALSPEHRLVVELSYLRGDSYEDIARVAGCPVNTVKSRMFYARRRLRTIMQELSAGAAKEY